MWHMDFGRQNETVATGDGKTQLPGYDTRDNDMYKPRRWLEGNPERDKDRRCLR